MACFFVLTMEKTDGNHRRRFFVKSLDGETVELSGDQAHHAINVLRLSDGEKVEVFDGAGGVADGTLCLRGRKRAEVNILRRCRARARPEPVVELAFAVPKGRRLDFLVEKATELGVARLAPVVFRRSVAAPVLKAHAINRWRGTCIAAAKQCGAEFLPEIAAIKTLTDFLTSVDADIRIVGHSGGDSTVPTALNDWSPGKRITILIGPEGGFTDDETDAAVRAGFMPVRLGKLTLRIETAAVALLASVKAYCDSM